MSERWIRVNEPRVVYEEVDGEVIMIDSTSGSYYSLNGTAAEVWRTIRGAVTASQVVAGATERFAGEADAVRAGVQAFLDQLVDAELIVEADETPEGAPPPAPSTRLPFDRPQLSAYTDMQDLMLLDPVHEVRDEGWPAAGVSPAGASGGRGLGAG